MNTKSKIAFIVLLLYALGTSWLLLKDNNREGIKNQMKELTTRYNRLLEQHINGFDINFAHDIKNKIKERNVLFYRFSQDMCEACIYEDLVQLRQIQDSIGSKHILILPFYEKDRGSMIRLSNELKGFRYQNVSQQTLGFPIDKRTDMEIRYMGYINNQGEIEMCFIPIKGEQELTSRYLSKLINLFFHK